MAPREKLPVKSWENEFFIEMSTFHSFSSHKWVRAMKRNIFGNRPWKVLWQHLLQNNLNWNMNWNMNWIPNTPFSWHWYGLSLAQYSNSQRFLKMCQFIRTLFNEKSKVGIYKSFVCTCTHSCLETILVPVGRNQNLRQTHRRWKLLYPYPGPS